MLHIQTNDIYKTKTDSKGLFRLTGLRGALLNITVEKKGYISLKFEGSWRNVHTSMLTANNRKTFKIWKLGEPQQLISHHLTRIGIPVDGRPVQFDLFSGKRVYSDGQLIVRLNRNPRVIPPRTRYDWTLELRIPNGGLVATNDDFMYSAPENGYQETFKYNMPKDAENWTAAINQQFYIELDNGKYFGCLVVRLLTIHDTPPLGINLDIVLNPSGSRDLQP